MQNQNYLFFVPGRDLIRNLLYKHDNGVAFLHEMRILRGDNVSQLVPYWHVNMHLRSFPNFSQVSAWHNGANYARRSNGANNGLPVSSLKQRARFDM